MKFRAVIVQDKLCVLANVVGALFRVAKLSHADKGTSEASTQLDIKLSPTHVLIRYCTPIGFNRSHFYAFFDTDEIFSELLINSRHNDLIGIAVDAKCLASALKAGLKAYRTVVKLAR